MAEHTDMKPGDTVSWPLGGNVSTGIVEKVNVDGVGGSNNHASDIAKPIEQEKPEVLVTHGATTVVKPVSEVEPGKPAQNHEVKITSSGPFSQEKKDERDHIPQKNEHGIAPKDGPNGSVRPRSKSPAVIPAPTAAVDKPVEGKKAEEPKPVETSLPSTVDDKPSAPVVPPPAPATIPVVATTVPTPASSITVASVPAAIVPPPVAAVPVVPAATSVPEPAKESKPLPVQAPPSTEAAPKKPGPKPKAPKKERPPKRAATETGEPRRSKRNKPT